MSFWAGVVQGVKDIDVLKEKEALADERQSVRDQENAYREQMRLYNEKRDGISDSRNAALDAINAEKWAFERAQMGQGVLNAANGLGIGGSTVTGGGGGGGSVPSPGEIEDNTIKFNGWLDTQLSDETMSQEDIDYLTNVSESFVDMKDSNEFWGVITGIRGTTGQMPTVAQLRESVSVTQIPGYADNKKKAVELLATINNMDMSTPAGLARATDLYNQLKKIDLNAATIDADTSGFLNVEDLGKLHTQQVEILDTELATNWLSAEDKAALDIAKGVSKDILMGDFRRKYGPQALEALTGSYPQQFSRYADNPAFRSFIGGTSSNSVVQEGGPGAGSGTGNGTGGDTAAPVPTGSDNQATITEGERRFNALMEDPTNPDLKKLAYEVYGKAEIDQALLDTYKRNGIEPGAADGLGSGSYGITPDNLEYTGGRDQDAPDAGDVAEGFTVRTPYTGMSLKDSAAELARLNAAEVTDQDAIDNLIEYMNATWKPEDVSKAFEYVNNQTPPPPTGLTTSTSPEGQFEGVTQPDVEATRYPLESGVPTPAGEGQVNIGGISVLSSVVAPYVEDKGKPLAPEEELAVGIEAIVKGLSGNGMDQAELDALIIEMQEKFGDEKVQEALVLAMNQ